MGKMSSDENEGWSDALRCLIQWNVLNSFFSKLVQIITNFGEVDKISSNELSSAINHLSFIFSNSELRKAVIQDLDNIKAFENEKYSNEENFENIKFSKYFNHRINSIVGNRRIIALCPELIDNNQEEEEEEIVWCQNMKEKSTVSKTEIKEEHTSNKTTNDIAENEKLNIDDNFWDTIEFDESDF